jgi:hypothetical protein
VESSESLPGPGSRSTACRHMAKQPRTATACERHGAQEDQDRDELAQAQEVEVRALARCHAALRTEVKVRILRTGSNEGGPTRVAAVPPAREDHTRVDREAAPPGLKDLFDHQFAFQSPINPPFARANPAQQLLQILTFKKRPLRQKSRPSFLGRRKKVPRTIDLKTWRRQVRFPSLLNPPPFLAVGSWDSRAYTRRGCAGDGLGFVARRRSCIVAWRSSPWDPGLSEAPGGVRQDAGWFDVALVV